MTLFQERADFAAYDGDVDGYLTEEEIEAYIADNISSFPFEAMIESFQRFYTCICARKFMFFLDPMRRGAVNLT